MLTEYQVLERVSPTGQLTIFEFPLEAEVWVVLIYLVHERGGVVEVMGVPVSEASPPCQHLGAA